MFKLNLCCKEAHAEYPKLHCDPEFIPMQTDWVQMSYGKKCSDYEVLMPLMNEMFCPDCELTCMKELGTSVPFFYNELKVSVARCEHRGDLSDPDEGSWIIANLCCRKRITCKSDNEAVFKDFKVKVWSYTELGPGINGIYYNFSSCTDVLAEENIQCGDQCVCRSGLPTQTYKSDCDWRSVGSKHTDIDVTFQACCDRPFSCSNLDKPATVTLYTSDNAPCSTIAANAAHVCGRNCLEKCQEVYGVDDFDEADVLSVKVDQCEESSGSSGRKLTFHMCCRQPKLTCPSGAKYMQTEEIW